MGSRGARGTLYLCALDARAKVLANSAQRLGLGLASCESLRMQGGRVEQFLDSQWRDTGLGLADVARTAYLDPLALPQGMGPGLEFHKT